VRSAMTILLASICLVAAACGDDETQTAASGASGPTGAQGVAAGSGGGGGESGEGSSASPQATVEASDPASVVKAVLTGDVATACHDFVSEDYVGENYGSEAGCEAAVAAGGVANSAGVEDVEVHGDQATAVAVPHGGPSSGERIDVKLVQEDDTWKVDDLKSRVRVGP
jgi:hypothetical protein